MGVQVGDGRGGSKSGLRHFPLLVPEVATFPWHSGSTRVAELSDAQLTPALLHALRPLHPRPLLASSGSWPASFRSAA